VSKCSPNTRELSSAQKLRYYEVEHHISAKKLFSSFSLPLTLSSEKDPTASTMKYAVFASFIISATAFAPVSTKSSSNLKMVPLDDELETGSQSTRQKFFSQAFTVVSGGLITTQMSLPASASWIPGSSDGLASEEALAVFAFEDPAEATPLKDESYGIMMIPPAFKEGDLKDTERSAFMLESEFFTDPAKIRAQCSVSQDEINNFNWVNSERSSRGVQQVGWSCDLIREAQRWSQYLSTISGLVHRNPISKGIDRGWRNLGENVAYNPSIGRNGAHNSFMKSSGHRANILNSSAEGTTTLPTSSSRFKLAWEVMPLHHVTSIKRR